MHEENSNHSINLNDGFHPSRRLHLRGCGMETVDIITIMVTRYEYHDKGEHGGDCR